MIVIPAIDIKDQRCVRLVQGKADAETIYSESPIEVARSFEAAGAQRLHLVDLDGAFQGKNINLNIITQIRRNLNIPIELGGGLRTKEDVRRMLDLGIDAVIVGTMAIQSPLLLEDLLKEYPGEQILLGVDSQDRKVATHGWEQVTEMDDIEFAQRWQKYGVERVIFTDISRDGMLSGPNLEALQEMAQQTQLRVTASGGVASEEDLHALRELENLGIDHVIVGKAIYEGTLSIDRAFSC